MVKKLDCDKVLIHALINGDLKSFEKIYNIYSRELYFVSMSYLNNVYASEDIIQDVFVYLWKNKANISEDSNIGAYLRKITKNMSLNCIRNKKIRNKHLAIIFDNSDECDYKDETELSINYIKEYEEKISFVNKKIKELPARCRKAFIMSVIDDLSYKDVSKKLGVSKNTIKTQIKIAYRKLRNISYLI